MTPAQYAFWLRAQRRAAFAAPELAARILTAFRVIRAILTDAELTAALEAGGVDAILQTLLSDVPMDVAFLSVRERLRRAVEQNVRYFAADLPKAGRINGILAIQFDYLNPAIITAVRTMETAVIQTLQESVRQTVRQTVEQGLRNGLGPRTIAQDLRAVIGLAPNQAQAVDHFRHLLETGDLEALTRELRDKRFDAMLRKALGPNGTGLTAEQVDRMVSVYRTKMIAFNAETNARTASLNAMKLGQHLAWQQAVDTGIVDPAKLTKTWRGVLDNRERPEHLAMEGQTVPYNATFSNGEFLPGDSTFNCRCTPHYTQAA